MRNLGAVLFLVSVGRLRWVLLCVVAGCGGTDAPNEPDGSLPIPDATVSVGTNGALLLRGTVLAPEGPIEAGEVLVEGTEILCVAKSCADHALAAMASVLETGGVISPGLIDAHNHLPYNFLPEWVPTPATTFEQLVTMMVDADINLLNAPT